MNDLMTVGTITHTCTDACSEFTVLASLQPLVSVRAPRTEGKADPIWDTEFRCKITKKPLPTTMVQPKGYTGPVDEIIQRHLAREDELIELIRTQHMEISPLSRQLAANGLAVTRFNTDADDEFEEGNFEVASDKHGTPYSPDPLTLAATSRRIEWEKAKLGCGVTSRTRWTVTEDGQVGIEYLGERWNDKEYALAQKRAFKADWLATHAAMPTVAEIIEAQRYLAYYGNPARFLMDEAEYERWLKFRKDGEPEQSMDDLGAEDLMVEDAQTGGPEELGMQTLISFMDRETGKRVVRTTFEPGENSSFWDEDADSGAYATQAWLKAV